MGLPSGLVTFCFTDIEGSTQLFARKGTGFLDLLEEHRRIIRTATAEHGGVVVRTEGDGFFLAFDDPVRSLQAVAALQRAVAGHPWPDDGEVRVRVGLHLGQAEPYEDDYMAFEVHEAARIGAAGHGGQTLLSEAFADAVRTAIPDGVTLRDLGVHELRDIAPMRLYQLDVGAGPADFPALRSTAGPRGYVPSTASSLIGREDDLGALTAQLAKARLVTVTGAGGIGKTRLAIAAARAELGRWSDGVWYVDLAPLTDPSWADDMVIAALGVVREPAISARAQIIAYLAERDAMVVIDNCEHVIDAAQSLIVEVLAACPGVTVLATSRESLGIDGEIVWRVRSLDVDQSADLFIERARAVRPGVERTGAVIDAVTRIVSRLDGIPLAIELAAARMRVLSAEQIAERLDDRFRLLTGGSKTSLARQRTLEATVDWSYALLDADEQTLFRRLSVFVGGFDLGGAEAVWDGNAVDLLDRLVDKSMVVTHLTGDTIRYRLLESIRHYGWSKLVDAGEADQVRSRHLAHFCDLVAMAAPGLLDEREPTTGRLLDAEHDNVRAALEWAFETGDAARALSIVANSWYYLVSAGRALEGIDWTERVLELCSDGDPDLIAVVHTGAAHLHQVAGGTNDRIGRHALAAVERARARPGPKRWNDGWAMSLLAAATWLGPSDLPVHEEALEWAREADDPFWLVAVFSRYAGAMTSVHGARGSRGLYDEVVEIARRTSMSSIATSLQALALVEANLGELDLAVGHAQGAVAAARRSHNVHATSLALLAAGYCRALRGDPDAEGEMREAASIAGDAGLGATVVEAELELGFLHVGRRDPVTARGHFERASELAAPMAMYGTALLYLAGLARHGVAETLHLEGRFAEARQIHNDNLALAEGVDSVEAVRAIVHDALGWIAVAEGEPVEAERCFRAAIDTAGRADRDVDRAAYATAAAVRGFGAMAIARGDVVAAVRLLASTARTRALFHQPRLAEVLYIDACDTARGLLDPNAFEQAWSEGHQLDIDDVVTSLSSPA